jgi:hypothetical protein
MKAIINGLRYDTEKAVCVGEESTSHLSRSDFGWWSAGLYRTPRAGRYFLAGEGGPMTRFAHHVKNGAWGGSKLIPMSREEAREWAERYLSTDEVEAGFAAEIQDA